MTVTDTDFTVLDDLEYYPPCRTHEDRIGTWYFVCILECGCDMSDYACDECHEDILEHWDDADYGECASCGKNIKLICREAIKSMTRVRYDTN